MNYTDIYPLRELVKDTFRTIQSLHSRKGQITGCPTGFIDLDHMTGGFQPGELIVIASRPSMGKTTFAMNIAQYLSMEKSRKIASAIFSLEMSKEQFAVRLLTATARIDRGRVMTGHILESDFPKLDRAAEMLRQSEIYIDDTSAIDIDELVAKARRMKADHSIGLIIIDYVQLIRGESEPVARQDEMSRISRSLKALARELNIPVIVLSQLNRSLEKRKKSKRRPELRDLGGAESLENDADVILFVYRESVYCKKCRRFDDSCTHDHARNAEIIFAKHRNGPIGTVCLAYFGEQMRFESL